MEVLSYRQHLSILHIKAYFFPYWTSRIHQEYISAFHDKLNYREITGRERM